MNIFSLPIIENAISIVLTWALIALFCSFIHEAIVQIKNERGRFFKRQLLRQLFDTPNQINWASLLYTHSSLDDKPPDEFELYLQQKDPGFSTLEVS